MSTQSSLLDKASKVNWKGPIAILTSVTIFLGIYTGGHYLTIGLFLGCAMSLSILILIRKTPLWVQSVIYDHPFASDLILSSLATFGISGFFGAGLTLGIGAVTCTLILSWALPSISKF